MNPDGLPFETSAGHRPPNSGADRFMVVLAVVVLLGAVLIIVGKVLPRGHESARATPTASVATTSESIAQPSRTPTPTPTPRPLGLVILLPGTPPSPSSQGYQFNGWVRAKTDVIMHDNPTLGSNDGTLTKGSLAFAWEDLTQASGDLGWLYVQDPQPGGWIATTPDGSSLVERFVSQPVTNSGDISGLVAGPNGYLAVASRPMRSDAVGQARWVASPDGAHWRWGSSSVGWGAAWGPAGWLSLSTQDTPDGVLAWIWNSSDGTAWSPLGAWVDARDTTIYASQLIGSARGYVLVTASGRGGAERATFWYSPDGQSWLEATNPGFDQNAWLQVAATPAGFYAWDQQPAEQRAATDANRVAGAFSADGSHWTPVDHGPSGSGMFLGAFGDRLLAITTNPTDGSAQVWFGSAGPGGFSWLRDPGQDQVFAGAVVSALASDGSRLAVFGWVRETERPVEWIRHGARWVRTPLPDSFGGFPRSAAVGPNGLVVIGYRTTLRGWNPIIWHQDTDGSWSAEADPLLTVVPDPGHADCPPLPSDALQFVLLDRVMAAACIGATPMTFRVWSALCDGCYGYGTGVHQPAWLAEPTTSQLFLAPIRTTNSVSSAVLAPQLSFDPAWKDHWVEVTGHFDDSAALSCEWLPGPDELNYYTGQQDVINGCRQTFVATAIRLVDGP